MIDGINIYICIYEAIGIILLSFIMCLLMRSGKGPWKIENAMRRSIVIAFIFSIAGAAVFFLEAYKYVLIIGLSEALIICAGYIFDPLAGLICGAVSSAVWALGTVGNAEIKIYGYAVALAALLTGVTVWLVRNKLFKGERPGPLHGLLTFALTAALYTLMLIATNVSNNLVDVVFEFVREGYALYIVSNALTVLISTAIAALLLKDKLIKPKEETSITELVQNWLLVAIVVGFIISSSLTVGIEKKLCIENAESTMMSGLIDVSKDIKIVSDKAITPDAVATAGYIQSGTSIADALEKSNAVEINIINSDGVVTDSTASGRVGYDFNEDELEQYTFKEYKNNDVYIGAYEASRYDSDFKIKYASVKCGDTYAEIGYSADYFQPIIEDSVREIAVNRHVGSKGYIVVLDKKWRIVSADQSFVDAVGEDYFTKRSDERNYKEEYVRLDTEIDDVPYFYMISHDEGYSISAMLPEEEVYSESWKSLYISIVLQILASTLLYVLIYVIIKNIVIDNILSINRSLSDIADGDLEGKVAVSASKEFVGLSDDINTTVDVLKGYIHEAESRIDAELEFARNIQASALPSADPAFPQRDDFDIYAVMQAAKEVGGDFYDYYITHNNILNFLIADVSGKSIPGAMFMMKAKSTIKGMRENDNQVEECFRLSNEKLCEGNDAGMFVTAWMATINLKYGNLYYANAGHNPPLVKRAGGKWEFVKGKVNFVLAAMETSKYVRQELQLNPGDEILLYTDGVTEATNVDNELYGNDRLLDFINSCEYDSVKELVIKLHEDVDAFTGEADQFDDITILGFRYIGKQSEA